MKDLHVSWDEYHKLIETLAYVVNDSGWKFDSLLCLSRGGLRPGDILSRIFDMPLNILATSSYREAAGTVQGELDIGQYIASSRPDSLKGKVLLVDDLVDSGLTFKKVTEHLKTRVPAITEVRTAVLGGKNALKLNLTTTSSSLKIILGFTSRLKCMTQCVLDNWKKESKTTTY